MKKYAPVVDYWLPESKLQLVEWLGNKYPGTLKRWEAMTRKRLYAIYNAIRSKKG